MFRGRATNTFAIRKSNVRQFKCAREREVFGSLFYSNKVSAVPSVSPLTCFKRTRKNQRFFLSNAPTNLDMQRYIRQQLFRRLASLERKQTLSFYNSYRFFTTVTKESRKPRKSTRKKKSLSPSSQKLTTKDRLRLSSRPSSSEKNGRQDESSMIKSPEELMERLNSGLDMARTAAREGYAALRNPSNPGNKHDNHLLSARTESSGIKEGATIEPKGLVMDVNWWFWNILFAASPAALIALYCQFIVIPVMKLRNEEREKDGDSESRGNSENKKSPMRQRQEQQKQQDPKIPVNDTMTKHSSSSPPSTSINELDEVLSSYFRFLSSWFSGQQPPTFERDQSSANKTDEVEKPSTKTNSDENQKQGGNEETSLEMQQRELTELLLRLQSLQDKIDRQQQEEHVDSIPGSDSDDVASENSAKREEPLLSMIGNRLKSTAGSGMNLGREQCRSLLSWWQTSRGYRRPSDERKRDTVDNVGDDGIVDTRNVDKKGKIEKPYQEVPRASRE